MVVSWNTLAATGNGESGFDSGEEIREITDISNDAKMT